MIPQEETRPGHPYFMHDMIHAQPDAIRTTFDLCKRKTSELVDLWDGVTKILTTGCGTSYHSALASADILRAILESANVEAVQSLELDHYYHALDPKTLTIGFSHSGTTKTTLDAVKKAASKGARTIGLTSTTGSDLTKTATEHLVVGNGVERSRAHTKSYTSAIAAAVFLTVSRLQNRGPVGSTKSILAHLETVPEQIQDIIKSDEQSIADLALSHGVEAKRIFIVGAGPNVATALEGALKLKETTYLAAEGMELEQFMHGPWVSLDKNALVILLVPRGPSEARSNDLLRALNNLGTRTLAITYSKSFGDGAADSIILPELEEGLTPLTYVVPLQLYAYYIAMQEGHNPDFIHYDDARFWASRMIIFPPGTH